MATITNVQSPKYGSAASNSVTVSWTSTPTSGNLLVARAIGSAATDGGAISGWTPASSALYGATSGYVSIFTKIAGGSEGNVTATFPSATTTRLVIEEWNSSTGWAATPLDQSTSTNNAGSTVTSRSTGTTGTTTVADELLVSVIGWGSAVTAISWSNSFTSSFSQPTGSLTFAGAHKIVSATGTQETTASWTTARLAGAAIATFATAQDEVSGSLDETLESFGISSNGEILVTGIESTSLTSLSISSSSEIDVDGELNKALSGMNVSSSATIDIAGAADANLDGISSDIDGTVDVTVSLSETLLDVVLSNSTNVQVSGSTAIQLSGFTLSSTGSVVYSDIIGELNESFANLTSSSEVNVEVAGQVNKDLSGIVISATGTVAHSEVTGQLNEALSGMAVSFSAEVEINSSAQINLNPNTLSGRISIESEISGNILFENWTSDSEVNVDISGQLDSSLSSMTILSTGEVLSTIDGALDQSLFGFTLSSTGVVGYSGVIGELSETLSGIDISSSAEVEIISSAQITLSSSILSGRIIIESELSGNILLENWTSSSEVNIQITGQLDEDLSNVTISASGSVLSTIDGILEKTFSGMTISSSGKVLPAIDGVLIQTLLGLNLSATGSVVSGIIGSLVQTLENAGISFFGDVVFPDRFVSTMYVANLLEKPMSIKNLVANSLNVSKAFETETELVEKVEPVLYISSDIKEELFV